MGICMHEILCKESKGCKFMKHEESLWIVVALSKLSHTVLQTLTRLKLFQT